MENPNTPTPQERKLNIDTNVSAADASPPPKSEMFSPPTNIKLGICAMNKKARSKHMMVLLNHFATLKELEIIFFPQDMILYEPIENWPVVDVLISFFSKGFPLLKAEEYAKLRKPFLINDITMQKSLLDRREVYRILTEFGVPVPRFAIMNREAEVSPTLIVEEDAIEINGTRLTKPFVEKPVDAEDHNIIIYLPVSSGGGSQHLFRKIGDRSSQFFPEKNIIRTDSSYIYEEFLKTQGTDVKVYSVGPEYYHAEARKAPMIDGKVNRDKDGKEVRYPIILTAKEKDIARRVSLAFKQTVCGFDLLRSDNGLSYVCDVNGWSFVKNSRRYYDDCAAILKTMLINHFGLRIRTKIPKLIDNSQFTGAFLHPKSRIGSEEVRCVIAVIRHADRTPKQKMKMSVNHPLLLSFFNNYGGDPNSEVKLKSAVELQRLLDITRKILSMGNIDEDGDAEETIQKLKQMRSVLEMGGKFSGINRKVQLKPQAWSEVPGPKPDSGMIRQVTSALLILKWAGELTPAGKEQAEQLGKEFRQFQYPGDDGLLRLHGTYRHDLKIYSSDEGRVQMTAAAFAKGLLDYEGELPPILVSLVVKDKTTYRMLDDSTAAHNELNAAKKIIRDILSSNEDVTEEFIERAAPTKTPSLVRSLKKIENPLQALHKLSSLLNVITTELQAQIKECGEEDPIFYAGESQLLVYRRWLKLKMDFFNPKKESFDISKIPDIYDCVKYDAIHNRQNFANPETLRELYDVAKPLADYLVPQEYGLTKEDKRKIGRLVCHELVTKILRDLGYASEKMDPSKDHPEDSYRLDSRFARSKQVNSPGRRVRTRLYFTSESHLQSLVNVLRYGSSSKEPILNDSALGEIDELNYLGNVVFRLLERVDLPYDDPKRFLVEISMSSGVSNNPFDIPPGSHLTPFQPPLVLSDALTIKELQNYLYSAISGDVQFVNY